MFPRQDHRQLHTLYQPKLRPLRTVPSAAGHGRILFVLGWGTAASGRVCGRAGVHAGCVVVGGSACVLMRPFMRSTNPAAGNDRLVPLHTPPPHTHPVSLPSSRSLISHPGHKQPEEHVVHDAHAHQVAVAELVKESGSVHHPLEPAPVHVNEEVSPRVPCRSWVWGVRGR